MSVCVGSVVGGALTHSYRAELCIGPARRVGGAHRAPGGGAVGVAGAGGTQCGVWGWRLPGCPAPPSCQGGQGEGAGAGPVGAAHLRSRAEVRGYDGDHRVRLQHTEPGPVALSHLNVYNNVGLVAGMGRRERGWGGG